MWQKALPELPSVRFNAKDSIQTYNIPEGYTKFRVDCVGAAGFNTGDSERIANGGRVQCTLTIAGITQMFIVAGKQPASPSLILDPTYNASDIRTNNSGVTNTTSLQSRLIVAGGAGNCGLYRRLDSNNHYIGDTEYTNYGGTGGGLIGGTVSPECGGGGTQTDGGIGAGFTKKGYNGTFGLGGSGVGRSNIYGGSGGAGWYGGGGGGHTWNSYHANSGWGGGGGSSYTHPDACTDVVHKQGYNDGDGYVIITPIG